MLSINTKKIGVEKVKKNIAGYVEAQADIHGVSHEEMAVILEEIIRKL